MRLRLAAIVVSLFLSSCGDSESEAPVTSPPTGADLAAPAPSEDPGGMSVSSPASETAAPAAAPPAPEQPDDPLPPSPALPAAPAAPTRAHVFVVPDEEARDELDLVGEELEHAGLLFIPEAIRAEAETVAVPVPLPDDAEIELEMAYPSFQLADPRLARLVNERVADFAHAQPSRDAPAVDCRGTATSHVVSITCVSSGITERSAFDPGVYSIASMHLAIEDGAVRPVRVAELFAPGTDVGAVLSAGCERYVEREGIDGQVECPRPEDSTAGAALGADGFVVTYTSDETEIPMADTVAVPYDELAPHLLARGPLAASLHRARVSTREIEVSASPATRAPSRSVWAVTPMASRADLAMTWARVPAPMQGSLRLQGGYLVGPDDVSARAAAAWLRAPDAASRMVPADAAAIAFRAMTTTRETPLLRMPHRRARIARTLPRDTRVVALGDAASGFVRVVAHAGAEGYVDARAIGAADACAPDLGPILESLPEAARADAPARTTRIVSRPPGARAIHLTELGETIHVEVHRVSDACALERRVVRFDRPGATLERFALTHSERGAGEPLVVTVARGEASRVLMVHSYRDGRVIWTHSLEDGEQVAVGQREEERWYPVVVEDAGGEALRRAVWADGALRLATAADTAPAAPAAPATP